MQVVIVRAVKRDTYPGVWCAHRFWPHVPIVCEVVGPENLEADEYAKIGLDPIGRKDKDGKFTEDVVEVNDMRPLPMVLEGEFEMVEEIREGKVIKVQKPKPHPDAGPEKTYFYKDGRKYMAARHRIGIKSLAMLRDLRELVSLEMRFVNDLSDVKIDEKIGSVEFKGEKAYVSELEADNQRMSAELAALKVKVAEFEKAAESKPAISKKS